MNAPKKIWVDEIYVAGKSSLLLLREEQFGCQEYIRADLVDGLVEALGMCVKHLDADGNLWSKEEQAMAIAALKALEEE